MMEDKNDEEWGGKEEMVKWREVIPCEQGKKQVQISTEETEGY